MVNNYIRASAYAVETHRRPYASALVPSCWSFSKYVVQVPPDCILVVAPRPFKVIGLHTDTSSYLGPADPTGYQSVADQRAV